MSDTFVCSLRTVQIPCLVVASSHTCLSQPDVPVPPFWLSFLQGFLSCPSLFLVFLLQYVTDRVSQLSPTELAALTSLISTVFQLMTRHFSLSSLHVCSCQPLLLSFSQSLQSGITLFSSLSWQPLLPSCSHSLLSVSGSVSLSPLAVTEILLKISVWGTKTFRTKVPVTYPRVYGKIFHFSHSIESNTQFKEWRMHHIIVWVSLVSWGESEWA